MIVDTHVHIFKPEHYNLEIYKSIQPPRLKAAFDRYHPEVMKHVLDKFPPERYLREAKGFVDRGILLPLQAMRTYGIHVPNEFVRDLSRKHPDKFSWCCCVYPFEKGAAEEVEKCVKEGAVGIGEIACGYQGFRADDERCYPVWEVAQALDVPVIIHTGLSEPPGLRVAHADVMYLDDVAIKFPKVKFVICHIGYPTQYKEAIYLMQKHENVFGDVSYLIKQANLDDHATSLYMPVVKNPYFDWVEPLAYYFSREWGFITGKLLPATDWPNVGPGNLVKQFTNLNQMFRKYNFPEVPEESIHEVLHENWKRVFKLPESPK